MGKETMLGVLFLFSILDFVLAQAAVMRRDNDSTPLFK